MAPLAKQVLFAAGGDVLAKYGTLVMRKSMPTRGGEIPYAFARTGSGVYLTNDVSASGLVVKTAAGGNVRIEQFVDPVNGALQDYLKFEAGGANYCLQSQTLATSPWGASVLTASYLGANAPDGSGTATTLVPTAVSSNIHAINQSITITAGDFIALSGFVRATGYTGAVIAVEGATGVLRWAIDLTAGTITNIGATNGYTNGGQTIIALGAGWYWVGVWGKTITDTSAPMFLYVFDTGAHAQSLTAYTGNGSSGIQGWGMQFERPNAPGLPPTSYIATTSAAVTRNAESLTVPYFVGPKEAAPMWIYARFIERGSAPHNDAFGPLAIGLSGTTAFARFDSLANPGYRWTHQTASGAVLSTPSGSPTFGQVAELLGFIFADGSVQCRQSINGAADTVGSQSGVLTFASAWSALQFQFGAGNGWNGLLSRISVGLGVGSAVNAIADVRNVL